MLRRWTKLSKRSRLMRPMGNTKAFTLAGAVGMRGSGVIIAAQSFPRFQNHLKLQRGSTTMSSSEQALERSLRLAGYNIALSLWLAM